MAGAACVCARICESGKMESFNSINYLPRSSSRRFGLELHPFHHAMIVPVKFHHVPLSLSFTGPVNCRACLYCLCLRTYLPACLPHSHHPTSLTLTLQYAAHNPHYQHLSTFTINSCYISSTHPQPNLPQNSKLFLSTLTANSNHFPQFIPGHAHPSLISLAHQTPSPSRNPAVLVSRRA